MSPSPRLPSSLFPSSTGSAEVYFGAYSLGRCFAFLAAFAKRAMYCVYDHILCSSYRPVAALKRLFFADRDVAGSVRILAWLPSVPREKITCESVSTLPLTGPRASPSGPNGALRLVLGYAFSAYSGRTSNRSKGLRSSQVGNLQRAEAQGLLVSQKDWHMSAQRPKKGSAPSLDADPFDQEQWLGCPSHAHAGPPVTDRLVSRAASPLEACLCWCRI